MSAEQFPGESPDYVEREEVLPEVSVTDDMIHDYRNKMGGYALLKAEQETELALAMEVGALAGERLELEADVLSDEEKRELLYLQHVGKTSHDRFITANLRLVMSIARRYQNRGLPMEDIIQEGNVGLLRAVHLFDYEKGFKFSTYATWWIRQSISRGIADKGRTVRLPVHMYEQVRKFGTTSALLYKKLDRDPSDEELAAELSVTVEKVRDYKRINKEAMSLNMPIGDGDMEFGDLIADTDRPDPSVIASRNELAGEVDKLLAVLKDERQVNIIIWRNGLKGQPEKTLQEIGDLLGVTRERVRQLEKSAMDTLKRAAPLLITSKDDLFDE